MKSDEIKTSWDFRNEAEKLMCKEYEKSGYIIEEGNINHLELIKKAIEIAYLEYINIHNRCSARLEEAHQAINPAESNDLRLFVMEKINQGTEFHNNYYKAAEDIIHSLCGNELAMQKRPGLSINLPQNYNDTLPIHADTWNGVSPFELNIWIPLVDCTNSMCLYILNREHYTQRLQDSKDLLKLTSDELFNELHADLTWLPIKYGKILAFDQSLPHGYSLNEEQNSHWSLNCRFKGLHTPYWDKKLGEYFMPITVKNCTRMGMNYTHPVNWI